jgi:ArsR family transcriptional regulator
MRQIEKKFELRAAIFKALANPLRLVMLEKLAEKPWCVCALAEELQVDKSIISKYLTQLKAAGLVDDTRRGTLVEYRLVAPCILQVASCAEETIMEHRRRLFEGLEDERNKPR